jgi:hypothetical protein
LKKLSLTFREKHRLGVFENSVLKKIFGLRWHEVTGDWIRPRNKEQNDLYFSPNIISFIKSRKVGWARHVARVGDKRDPREVLVGHLIERDRFDDPGVDGRVILKWIFSKWYG